MPFKNGELKSTVEHDCSLLIHKIKLLPSEPLVRSVLFDSETDLLEGGDEVGEEDSENEDERSSPTSAIFVYFALYK